MLLQSQRHSMARPTSHGSFRMGHRAAAVHRTPDRFAVRSSRLHDHLLRDHGRTAGEIARLPLTDLHRFEHVEQAMGLLEIGHQHPAEAETRAGVSTEATAMIPLKLS
jgi:hypothetical protein